MLTRRAMFAGLAAGCLAPAANAHSLYNQWVVYRKKHLLIGSHREDPVTYDLAQEVASVLEHLVPEAKARAARAPHAERLASLLGTGQMEIAVLAAGDVSGMQDGAGRFAPYGRIPLNLVADLSDRLLVAPETFPAHHAWLVSAAMGEMGYGIDGVQGPLALHPGAEAQRRGVPLDGLP